MSKIILIVIILFYFISAFGQDQQKQGSNSGVELPDFIITGTDVVSLRHVQKIPPDFIPAISEEFLKPVFPTENLKIKEVSTPVKGTLTMLDTLNYQTGNLEVGLGSYYLPSAKLNFSNPFSNGLFEIYGDGENRRAYVPNSDRYSLKGGASLSLYVQDDASILPGSQFKFSGDYGLQAYKLYGSNIPNYNRTLNTGNASFGLNNLMDKYFLFSAKVSDNLSSLKGEHFSENMVKLGGYTQFGLYSLNLGADVNFKKQTISNDVNPNSMYGFIAIRPTINLNISDKMKVNAGFNYANSGSNNFFSPYGAIGIDLGNGLSVYGDFSPQAEFYGGGHFLAINPYFMPQKFTNIFLKKNMALSASLKYEFFTYVEIDGGFKYYSSDNMPYFLDTAKAGMFDLSTTSSKSFTLFANLLFHPGPNGVFYATGEFNDTRNTANNFVPYTPRAKVTLNYGYNFKNGLDAEANLEMLAGMYSDIQNKNSINPYINLGCTFGYMIKQDFYLTLKISNILNQNISLWRRYKELPLDITAGLKYNW